jgi:hypothetical protein
MKEQLEFPMEDHKTTIIVVMLLISIFALSFLTTSPAFSQEVKDTVITEELAANQIINNIVDKATIAVSSIADALKVPAEHVYNVLVRQSIVIAISNTIIYIIIIIVTYLLYNKAFYYYNFTKKEYPNRSIFVNEPECSLMVIAIMCSITCFIVIISTINKVISGFINPEYLAIKEILNIF